MTTLEGMFYKKTTFNEDISKWDVSNVLEMTSIFNNAFAFNADISEWKVNKVAGCYKMFFMAQNSGGASILTSKFNSDLSKWRLSPTCTGMQYLFAAAVSFNSDISSWVRLQHSFFFCLIQKTILIIFPHFHRMLAQ